MPPPDETDLILAPGLPPSGEWRGRLLHPDSEPENVRLRLSVTGGRATGEGTDDRGGFAVDGTCDPADGACDWVLRRDDAPVTRFRGTFDGTVILGVVRARKARENLRLRLWPAGREWERPIDRAQAPQAGAWEGFFVARGRPRPFVVQLTFAQGRLDGEGREAAGWFDLHGTYEADGGVLAFHVAHPGRELRHYAGVWFGTEAWGGEEAHGRRSTEQRFGMWYVTGRPGKLPGDVDAWLSQQAGRRQRAVLDELARRLGGKPTGSGVGCVVRWPVLDGSAMLRFDISDSAVPSTLVRVEGEPPGVLRITPQTFLGKLRTYFDAPEIEVGDSRFDRRFLVFGSPRKWVAEALDADARSRIHWLADLGGDGNRDTLRLELGPVGLAARVEADLRVDPRDALRFATLGADLARPWFAHRPAAGVHHLTAREVAAAGDCPVCGTGLSGPLARCSACRTLHHQECWTYLGGCAIYACAGRAGQGMRP